MDPRERRKKYYNSKHDGPDWRRILQWAYFCIVHFFALAGVLSLIAWAVGITKADFSVIKLPEKKVLTPPEISEELLTVNEYSRPGIPLEQVNGIVIHYTANPGTTAEQNRSYFEGLKDSGIAYVSAHYVIGMDGKIIHCVPDDEVSYASNDRNGDTISIECCHADETGQFSKETYDSLLWLTAYLMGTHDVPIDNVIRHYDVNGKPCPKYYVDHPESWEALKADVLAFIEENGDVVSKQE